MKIEFEFQQTVFNLPEIDPVTLLSLSGDALRVLIAACASRDTERIASRLNRTEEQVLASVSELEKAGIVNQTSRLIPPSDEAPKYSGEEVERIVKTNPGVSALLEECAGIAGKVLGPMEAGKVLSLVDYLRLDEEYVVLLFSYLARQGKRSVAYLEKTAYSLVNDGCDTVPKLTHYIRKKDTVRSSEGEMRRILGAGDRPLTSREKDYIAKWLGEDAWAFSVEMVARAFEITVDAIGKQSLPYTDKILGSWFEKQIRTLKDVEAEQEERKNKKDEKGGESDSFDVNDFFGDAIRRSYEQMGADGKD